MYGYLFDSWVNYLTISLSFTNIKIIRFALYCRNIINFAQYGVHGVYTFVHAYEPIILALLNYLHVCCFNLSIFCNFKVFKESNVFPPFSFFFKRYLSIETFWYPLEWYHISDILDLGSLVQNTQTFAFVLFVYVF